MDFVETEDPSGKGSWITILGCPLTTDQRPLCGGPVLPGPTFSACAACEYQTGTNVELVSLDGEWSQCMFPERLQCGYRGRRRGAG